MTAAQWGCLIMSQVFMLGAGLQETYFEICFAGVVGLLLLGAALV